MTTWLVKLLSFDGLKTWGIRVTAPNADAARKKIVGTIVTDPWGYEYKVEEYDIIGVYPYQPPKPPPYRLMPEERVLEAEWLKGAKAPEEGLAYGSDAVGPPKLEAEYPNSLTKFIFSREVKSKAIRFLEHTKFRFRGKDYEYLPGWIEDALPWSKAKELCAVKFKAKKWLVSPTGIGMKEGDEVTLSEPEDLAWAKLQVALGNLEQITTPAAEWLYPEYKTKVKYIFDIYTKFLSQARLLRKTDKIKEAILYLIEYTDGIPLDYLTQILDISYWTCWRAVAELARPTEYELRRIRETIAENATLEKWTKQQEEEIATQLKTPKPEPKIGIGYWHNRLILYPLKRKTEQELLTELKRILTLEGYPKLSKAEEEELERQIHEYWEKKARERLTYWLK